MDLRIEVRKWMIKRRLKPAQLAAMVGMSERTLYNIFEGRKCPTILELERFARALNVHIEDLYISEYSRNYKERQEKKY